ncbi:MAG: RNA polymerase subunit sigma-70 [Roseovarius sp.]|nr:RNA polymerase subunit sigma-70 [Roseovarius sp.]MDF1710005.1 sigma-70 family RNA polymerase sigma factor [Paracoccaceae bacterium]
MASQDSRKREVSGTSPERALLDGRGAFMGFLVKRLGNRADAEDVLQEFCIRVLTRKDQLRDVDRMDAWLYTILRSTLNDHYRKGTRRSRLAAAAAHEPEDWIADAPSQMARLCTCHEGLISELRPAESELIRRIDFGEEDRETVAADLGLTRNALGVRLHRARTALREALTAHCGSCCREDREDCSCPPRGCANVVHETDCEDVGQEH